MDLIKELNKETLANEVAPVQIGDTVRVHVKVKEGSRERIQVFEGTVIAKKSEKGDPFSPVQVQVKHRNRYLIVQALPGSLTTVTISR